MGMKPAIACTPGKIAVVREFISDVASTVTRLDGSKAEIIKPQDRADFDRKVNQWSRVFGVGGPLTTQRGDQVTTDIKVGDIVAVSQAGINLPLTDNAGETLWLYLIPFEAVLAVFEWECENQMCAWRTRRECFSCEQCGGLVAPTAAEMAIVS